MIGQTISHDKILKKLDEGDGSGVQSLGSET